MNEEAMNGMTEEISTSDGEKIKIDPNFIMEAVDDVSTLVDANVAILKSVRSIIKKGIASGLTAAQASAVALEFQRRAAKKGSSLVHYDENEGNKEGKKNEEGKGSEENKDATDEE